MEYSFIGTEERFSFDAQARTIVNLDNAARKHLSSNESILLGCLLNGAQTKEKLMQNVWFDRGVVVTDASYYQLVTQLRKSFEELGLPKRGIKTIPRYGLELTAQAVGSASNTAPGELDATAAAAAQHAHDAQSGAPRLLSGWGAAAKLPALPRRVIVMMAGVLMGAWLWAGKLAALASHHH